MNKPRIDAVIFDLDGVITNSTPLHSKAWKQMFDVFLKTYAKETNTPFREFTHEEDYLFYIDGKPRYIGVESFLESRGIAIPYGDPSQEPDQRSICGLGNRKNELYNQLVTDQGVEIYATSIEFIHELKDAGIPLGLATSSKNAERVLELTGLIDLFQTRVDGVVSAELGLEGKPSPDIFRTACDRLGAEYDYSVIIEDANSGVQAGYQGHFGLVLGVARENNAEELVLHGADLVVNDLLEINLKDLYNWFSDGKQKKGWSIEYFKYNSQQEGTREALCSVGNGYFATRGAMEEIPANEGKNYPGTYIAGVYNTLESNIAGRKVSNEDIVNCPNWLPISFRIDSGDWFNPIESNILEFHQNLDFKTGILSKTMIVRDQDGKQTRITSSRLASMANPHLAAIEYIITPLNYAGKFSIRSEIDGSVSNRGVTRYRDLSSRHLEPRQSGGENNISFPHVETNQSKIQIEMASKLRISLAGKEVLPDFRHETDNDRSTITFEIEARSDSPLCIEKVVAIHSSNVPGATDTLQAAKDELTKITDFRDISTESSKAWEHLWSKMDIKISGDRLVQKLIRLHLYHSLISYSPHNVKHDVGIPARGLTGESYRGHIFWDELFILPFYSLQFKDSAQSALMYRFNRLAAAQEAAKENGYAGAQFPWQSGSSGKEETQSLHLNPLSGKWGPDLSHLQRHVSLAITYNLWNHYWITKDSEFLIQAGAELLFSLCQYWTGLAEIDRETGRYSINNVMGPDEFHESDPASNQPGLSNNAYSNLMAVWTINRAFDILDILPNTDKERILDKLTISQNDLNTWKEISEHISIPISENGILEQFQGYFDLKELDWDHYKSTYQDIHRMDRILKAEGLFPNSFKVAKQADALMLFFNLSEKEISSLLRQLGYDLPDNMLDANLHYYLQRTSHGSTLSRLVHAYLAHISGNFELSWKLYQESLRSDFIDIQKGTTREGIHLGVMTGTVLFALRAYAGLDWTGRYLPLNPALPPGWKGMEFNICFQGNRYYIQITPGNLKIKIDTENKTPISIGERIINLKPGKWTAVDLND